MSNTRTVSNKHGLEGDVTEFFVACIENSILRIKRSLEAELTVTYLPSPHECEIEKALQKNQ